MRAKAFLAGIAVIFVLFPIAKYIALHSNVMDLGRAEYLHVALSQGEWQAALSGHIQGYSLALASFMPVYMGTGLPVGIGLVAIQALLLILPIYFLFRIAGVWVALAYVAYSPVWINAHFDFHYDHLAVPLLLGFYLCLRSGRSWRAFLFASLLVFIKEPFALQTAACGIWMILMAVQSRGSVCADQSHPELSNHLPLKGHLWLAGMTLILLGGGYFYIATHFVLPYFAPTNWSVFGGGAFSWLGNGLGEIAGNILTHPLAILKEVLTTPGKLFYLFAIFGLLAFIPLLAPSYLIPAIPLLAIAMLSRLPNYYDYNTHYTAGLIIPVMFAFVHGLPKAHALWMKGSEWMWRKGSSLRFNLLPPEGKKPIASGGNLLEAVTAARLSKAFYVLLALWIFGGHVMLSPSPISRLFWSDKVWSYSWRAYVPTAREAMMKAAMLKHIPADPSVSVATQNTVNWYHLAHREVYMPFPLGVTESIGVMDWSNRALGGFWNFVQTGQIQPAIIHNRYADYVVLDIKRPWFIIDKGCDWLYGACRNDEMAAKFLRLMDETRQRYDTVFEQDGFMILKRNKRDILNSSELCQPRNRSQTGACIDTVVILKR